MSIDLILYNLFCVSALCQHRFSYNLIDSPNCPHCGEIETTSHYLFYCPEYVQARTTMLESLQTLNIDVTNKITLLDTILHGTKNHNQNLLEIIYRYLRDSHRFI